MRKVVSLLVVLVLCMSMVLPVFAAEDAFVPSITYKPNPEFVPIIGEDGNEYIGVITDESGEILGYLEHSCLLITPVAYVWDPLAEVPTDVREELVRVYEGLKDGTMEVPYSDTTKGWVVRDLFDVRWSCEEHAAMLEASGATLKLIFDMGVIAGVDLVAHTVDDATGEWDEAVSTTNNGDGTVTVEVEHLCVVAVSMVVDSAVETPAEETESSSVLLWIVLLAVAVIALVVILFVKKKGKKAA